MSEIFVLLVSRRGAEPGSIAVGRGSVVEVLGEDVETLGDDAGMSGVDVNRVWLRYSMMTSWGSTAVKERGRYPSMRWHPGRSTIVRDCG